MNSIGRNIQCLRKAKGVTQEKMAQQIGVTFQAISKWENEYTLPDIMLLPVIADYFGISIDDLFQYKWNAATGKERLIDFMLQNGILCIRDENTLDYSINTEQFTTNQHINAIGEAFALCLLENDVDFDAIAGIAYHGIAFAASAAMTLQSKYGVTAYFCYDRMAPGPRGRCICGHTPCDGDRFVFINSVLDSGSTMEERISRLQEYADIEVAAILTIAQTPSGALAQKMLEEKYHTKVYSLLNDEEIRFQLRRRRQLV